MRTVSMVEGTASSILVGTKTGDYTQVAGNILSGIVERASSLGAFPSAATDKANDVINQGARKASGRPDTNPCHQR